MTSHRDHACLVITYDSADDVYHVNDNENTTWCTMCTLPEKADATIVNILDNWHSSSIDDRHKAILFAKSVFALQGVHFCKFYAPTRSGDLILVHTDFLLALEISSSTQTYDFS